MPQNNTTLSRKVSYPVVGGAVMSFHEGQVINVMGVKCELSSILHIDNYTEIEATLPEGPRFVWKTVYDSGVVLEHKIDSLL